MRYILNDTGYIEAVSFGCSIECKDKTCTEYTGTIPEGYETLAIWSETANINAYKIVDGNLTYDSEEDARLQAIWESQLSVSGETNTNIYSTEEQMIGTWVNGKPLYRKTIVLENGTGTTNMTDYMLINYDIQNVEEIFIVSPSYYSLREFTYPFNFYDGNQYTVQVCPTYLRITTQYEAIAKSKMVITIEYTKTTD